MKQDDNDHSRTEEKFRQQSTELWESRDLLKATMDSSVDIIQVFKAVRNERGEIVDFVWLLNNKTSEKLYGNVIGKSLLTLNPGVVTEGIFDAFKQVVETGVPDQSERHYVHEQFNGWFFQSTVKLDDGVATTTRDITERKKDEQEILRLKDELLQKTNDKYYSLFNSIDDDVAIIELERDENGKITDMIYRETNAAFERHTGWKNIAGKRASELLLNLEQIFIDIIQQVADTGEPYRKESYVAELDRWYDALHSPIGQPGSPFIAVVLKDITERKNLERRQNYLLKLSDALRSPHSALEIQRAAMRVVGEFLQADRVLYTEFDADVQEYYVADNYVRPGIPKRIGRFKTNAFPGLIRWLARGETSVIDNVRNTSMLNDAEKEALIAVNTFAFIGVPLIKGEQLVAQLGVQQRVPREWTHGEISILQETAERTWAAVERAKAEEAQRESEARLSALLEAVPIAIGMANSHGQFILYNRQMQNFIPGNTPPSHNAEHSQRWMAWHRDGSRIEPDDFPGPRALRGELVGAGMEILYTLDDGRKLWTRVSSVPIRNKQGEITGTVTSIVDIDELKRSTETLQNNRQQLALSLGALQASEKNLKELNENLEQLVEKRTQELIKLKVRQEKEKLNAVIFAQEQERARIGEGLHNGVAQLLYAAQSHLQMLTPEKQADEKTLKAVNDILMDAIYDTRKISFELMPPVLKDYGLQVSLDALIQRIVADKPKVQLEVSFRGRLPENLEITIYRIAQEILNNILKHAHATEASIHLYTSGKSVHLKVSDNGVGFVVQQVKGLHRGIGLQSIANRVKLFEGKMKVSSAPEQGTTIELQLPLKEK